MRTFVGTEAPEHTPHTPMQAADFLQALVTPLTVLRISPLIDPISSALMQKKTESRLTLSR